jgi:protein-S-isoprenylcysteine O-methyltransferase Ste14
LKLEEANLRRTFGQNYDQYVANTPRFMPKLW